MLPERQQIKDLSYAHNEHLGLAEIDRKAISDLYCEGESGEKFIVEIQNAKQNYVKDRSVYYASFPIQEQVKKGDKKFKILEKTLEIAIEMKKNDVSPELIAKSIGISLAEIENL